MEIKITNEQKVHVKLNPKTSHGNPAALDGAATFTVVSGDCTVEPDADGLGATITSGTLVADSQISVSADADLGAGVDTITDTIIVTVTAPEASSFGIVADAPTDK